MKGKAILVLGILFWSLLQAGLGDYNFSYSVSSWQELSSANNLGDIDTDEENFTNPDYPAGQTVTYGTGLPIGFDFYFDGHVYDRFGVNANGWIGLGKSEYGLRSVDLLSSSYASPLNYINASHPYEDRLARIAGFARDLAAQSGASLSYATLGTAPERVLVVQWKNYRRRNASAESFNFQIQLHESGSEVRIVYGQMQSSGTFTVQVGMRAMPAAEASNFATLNTNDGWTYSTPGSAANTAAVISATNYPIAGACFRWQPPNHAQADFVAYPQSGFAPLSVNFTDQSTAGASPITSWFWTFGDGGTSNAQNPSHIYQNPGTYTVSLTTTDGDANQATKTRENYISAYVPATSGNCYLEMDGFDAHISWDPISTDEHGLPLDADYYYLYFNGSADPEAEYYFLAPITYPTTDYIHQGVGRGARHMFYRVKAINTDD